MKHIITANIRILKSLKVTSSIIVSGDTAKRQLLTVTNDYKSFSTGDADGLIDGAKASPIDNFINLINLTPSQQLVAEKIDTPDASIGEVWKVIIRNKIKHYWFF